MDRNDEIVRLRRFHGVHPHSHALGFELRALPGILLDCACYVVACAWGSSYATAHIVAFVAGLTSAYALQLRPALVAAGRDADLRWHARLLAVGLYIVCLRGGMLAWLIDWGQVNARLAIVPVALISAVLLRVGYGATWRAPWAMGHGARWQALALGAIGSALALRLLYLGQVQLMPEEAYYWNYAQHLAPGYLDHPPMVAWLIKLGTLAFGDDALGVRAGAFASALVATFFIQRLTRNLFGDSSALVAIVLMQLLPFYFLAGMMMTPDAPLVAAWAASAHFLERALLAGRGRAWWGVGVSLGAGLLCKYTIGLLGPAALLFALLDPRARAWLRRPAPYLACGAALLIFSPVIVWNAQHDWASFAFQTSRRLADTRQFALHKLIGSILVILTPTGLATLGLVWMRRRGRRGEIDSMEGGETAADALQAQRRWRFLACLIGVPLSVFLVFSLYHEVKLDWTGALWTSAVPVLAASIAAGASAMRRRQGWIDRAWGPTLVGVLLVCGGLLHYLVLGLPGCGYSRHVEDMPVIWRELGEQVGRAAGELSAGPVPPLVVGMDRYVLASELAFYVPRSQASATAGRNLFGRDALMYEQWITPADAAGRTLLLVAWASQDLDEPEIASRTERLGPIRAGTLVRYGHLVRHYYFRAAYGYRGGRAG